MRDYEFVHLRFNAMIRHALSLEDSRARMESQVFVGLFLKGQPAELLPRRIPIYVCFMEYKLRGD